MISGAEAHRIGGALESVAGWTSEIVVVLNEDARDGTEEMCLRHGARVFREPWKGFIGQKNSVAAMATQPWLLNLDADEQVSPALQKEITRLLEGAAPPPPCAAYEFPRCTFFCGRWIRHGDWYPDRVRRLWRRGAAQWAGEEPHARLEVNGQVGRLRSDLLHFTAESIDRQVVKLGPYSDSFVREALAAGRGAGALTLALRPAWRFVRAYFLRLGFLDGWQGYYLAWLVAFSTVTRYAKVREARLASRR
jgi:glycosyltransferase involved in cell wall biosynthesis